MAALALFSLRNFFFAVQCKSIEDEIVAEEQKKRKI